MSIVEWPNGSLSFSAQPRELKLREIMQRFSSVTLKGFKTREPQALQERELLLLELWDKIRTEADVIRLQGILNHWEEQ